PKYHVRVEERVYISDESDPGRAVIVPDLQIAPGPDVAHRTVSSQRSAGATVEPVLLTTLIEDEIHEPRLEIIDRESHRVVTVIEILSPTNKIAGSRGRESYRQKRHDIMNSSSHFVEIDLLRGGTSILTRELL